MAAFENTQSLEIAAPPLAVEAAIQSLPRIRVRPGAAGAFSYIQRVGQSLVGGTFTVEPLPTSTRLQLDTVVTGEAPLAGGYAEILREVAHQWLSTVQARAEEMLQHAGDLHTDVRVHLGIDVRDLGTLLARSLDADANWGTLHFTAQMPSAHGMLDYEFALEPDESGTVVSAHAASARLLPPGVSAAEVTDELRHDVLEMLSSVAPMRMLPTADCPAGLGVAARAPAADTTSQRLAPPSSWIPASHRRSSGAELS